NPAAVVDAGADRPLDVGQRGVDDLDVEDRHECAERRSDDGDPCLERNGTVGGWSSGRARESGRRDRIVVHRDSDGGHGPSFLAAKMRRKARGDNRENAERIVPSGWIISWCGWWRPCAPAGPVRSPRCAAPSDGVVRPAASPWCRWLV